ncbi:Amino acid-binding ACT [Desulfurella amilsii]|uniref:Amino acid-binding ACT n=1 Tax=Desulfurella amilsii TaxID=1562698 RepID=A0A1X4XWP1_9BACT|nr:amino acid-binding protein [Desulfurella amilsii]OSS41951.1 Amino acid-binding ACT [Desulfurella amilsii]
MKRIKQISVFVENKPGRLLDVVEVLGSNDIDIKAISLADSSDFGIVRLICEDPESAYKVIAKNDFTASLTEVLAIAISDKPGSLAKVLRALKESGINIEYMYGFSAKMKDYAVMIMKVSNLEETIKCCISNNIRILSESDIKSVV